jgi:hypothetical protein
MTTINIRGNKARGRSHGEPPKVLSSIMMRMASWRSIHTGGITGEESTTARKYSLARLFDIQSTSLSGIPSHLCSMLADLYFTSSRSALALAQSKQSHWTILCIGLVSPSSPSVQCLADYPASASYVALPAHGTLFNIGNTLNNIANSISSRYE